MKKLSYESLLVYQRAIEFVAWGAEICESNVRVTGEIQSQFKRAFIAVPLNIAEGSGKQTGKDQAKFYDIARGSALECGACLDVLVAMKVGVQTAKSVLADFSEVVITLGWMLNNSGTMPRPGRSLSTS